MKCVFLSSASILVQMKNNPYYITIYSSSAGIDYYGSQMVQLWSKQANLDDNQTATRLFNGERNFVNSCFSLIRVLIFTWQTFRNCLRLWWSDEQSIPV